MQTFQGDQVRFNLSVDCVQGIHSLCRETGTTPFMLLYTTFAILLYRYSGQEDILVGAPIANRNRRELEPLIGFFSNTLVLRTDLSHSPTVRTLLSQMQQTMVDANTLH